MPIRHKKRRKDKRQDSLNAKEDVNFNFLPKYKNYSSEESGEESEIVAKKHDKQSKKKKESKPEVKKDSRYKKLDKNP